VEIRLPQLAEGADSGTVANILVAPGDKVRKDQTVLEVENQKAVAPIPSPAAGAVSQVHVKQGDTVSVGQLLVTLSEEAGEPFDSTGHPELVEGDRSAQDRPAEPRTPSAPSASGMPPPASPSIRKMARELGVDLSKVPGSGNGGRITPEDVRHYMEGLQKGAAPQPPKVDFAKWGPVTREPFTPMRQAIARAMEDSWKNIPHVTLFDKADIAGIQELIRKHGPSYEKEGLKLTLTGFVIRALAQLLKNHPRFNSSLDETSREIVLKIYIHIGIAVDTEAGLIVPVLRDADKKSVREISRGLQELAEKARSRKLTAEELQGGTFTISNQGGIGGGHFTPIIHRPEVAILGLGRARNLLPLSLSFDHRVLDGADAARFMKELVEALENFNETP
jgi:pyruvate dehydrogenase E2 component (dihydrolipoamide acetyltransferase)